MNETSTNNVNKRENEQPGGAPSKDNGEGGSMTHLGGKNLEKRTETNEIVEKEQERTRINKNLFIENWVQHRGVVEVICTKLGLSKTQFYKWKKEDPEFVKRLKAIDENAEDEGEDLLKWFAFMKKDPTMLRFWLRANHSKYKLKITQEIIGGGAKSLKELFDEFDKELEEAEKNGTGKNTTENTSEKNPETKVGEITVGVPDQGQTPTPSPIHVEQSPSVLLEKKDEKKSDSESSTKGHIENHRRGPAPRLHSERN